MIKTEVIINFFDLIMIALFKLVSNIGQVSQVSDVTHGPLVLQMMEALSNLPELERRVVEQSEIGVTYGRSGLYGSVD